MSGDSTNNWKCLKEGLVLCSPFPKKHCALILIPAYQPSDSLYVLAEQLVSSGLRLLIVDDGSGPEFESIFEQCKALGATVIVHAANCGKGAALKTGIGYIIDHFPDCIGVVTADADGQHHEQDIKAMVAEMSKDPGSLIVGARAFGVGVPFRSKFGNHATKTLFRALTGHPLNDTQTGLRAIPACLLQPLLQVNYDRYEFELEMLLLAHQAEVPVREHPIRTIYANNNSGSHFKPFMDSMRVYFVLFRFTAISMITAVVDNCVFLLCYRTTSQILISQALARAVALAINYVLVYKAVFFFKGKHSRSFPNYFALVVVLGIVSFSLIKVFVALFHIHPVYAKIIAETLLFIVNFIIQRDFVFRKDKESKPTDWEAYYRNVPFTADLQEYTLAGC